MAAAEKDTIIITARDSLNNCCLLGQTTSLSSSNVEVKKFFFFLDSFISEDSVTSGGSFLRGFGLVGLVTKFLFSLSFKSLDSF